MRLWIATALIALAATLLWAGEASAEGPLMLQGRAASSLTVSWSWGGQTASAWELAWRTQGEDNAAVWRSVRKAAAQRRHTIGGLDAGTLYTIRVRALNANDRPLATLQSTFATSSAAAEGQPLDPRLRRGLADRLTLDLASSRELCTAGTLTEISWQIAGGKPPYKLQVEDSPANADADHIRINCGALTEAEAADEDVALAAKRIIAAVTDARGARREAAIKVARARALPAPTNVAYVANLENVLVLWDEVLGAGSQSPQSVHPVTRNQLKVSAAVRTRPNRDGAAWSYHVVDKLRHTSLSLEPPPDLRVFSVAAVRHPLELETPNALSWSDEIIYGATKPAQNVTLTSTHDTVTVSWDRQPYAHSQRVELRLFAVGDDVTGPSRRAWVREEPGVSGRHQVTFNRVPANTDLSVAIDMTDPDSWEQTATFHAVRTKPAPAGWTPPARGPQNLRYVVTDGVLEILWDEPFPGAQRHWMVFLTDPVTGRAIGERAGVGSWTLSPWIGVAPATRYQATVIHIDLAGGQATIDIMTPPAPRANEGSSPTP